MTKKQKQAFKQKRNYKIASFSLSVEALEKLDEIAEYENKTKSELLQNYIFYNHKRIFYDKPTKNTPETIQKKNEQQQKIRRKIEEREEWNETFNRLMIEDLARLDAQREEEERNEKENKKASQKPQPQKINDPLNKALDKIAEDKDKTTKEKYKSMKKEK